MATTSPLSLHAGTKAIIAPRPDSVNRDSQQINSSRPANAKAEFFVDRSRKSYAASPLLLWRHAEHRECELRIPLSADTPASDYVCARLPLVPIRALPSGLLLAA
jgi:hypothetical protein